jgi:uncharacterized membrane protein (DUF2068 family)
MINKGLRAIAFFEACKGALVMLAGLTAFSLIHENVQVVAEQLVQHMHLNPARHVPRILVESAGHLTDGRLRMLAFFALLYSAVRYIEAYGLWFGKRWAEWFALLSGGIYLPAELYELFKGFTWLKTILVAVNLLVILYMAIEVFSLKKRHYTIGKSVESRTEADL